LTKTILLVDDEEGVRSVLSEFLTGLGYNVVEASDGKTALELFRKQRMDLVITDLYMPPGISGTEVMKNIKVTSPKTPVLIITGYRPTKSQEDAMTTKADGYLIKPFELERLKATIRQFIR